DWEASRKLVTAERGSSRPRGSDLGAGCAKNGGAAKRSVSQNRMRIEFGHGVHFMVMNRLAGCQICLFAIGTIHYGGLFARKILKFPMPGAVRIDTCDCSRSQ